MQRSWRLSDTDLSVDVGRRRTEMPGENSTINTMTMEFEGGGLFDDDDDDDDDDDV
jgi:hypothetical protein